MEVDLTPLAMLIGGLLLLLLVEVVLSLWDRWHQQ